MSSAAERFGRKTIAVLLTRMGKDGAKGMADVCKAGGLTIAQDEASSVVFGMPREAINLKAAQYVLDVNDISQFLLNRI